MLFEGLNYFVSTFGKFDEVIIMGHTLLGIDDLYYERVLDNCNDSNCILTSNFRNQMNELIQNHYYFIDQDTFDNYLDG